MNPVRASMFYVYVLRNHETGRLYTGYTSDLRKRLTEHNSGPYEPVYYEACLNEKDASGGEKYLKTGMGKRYLKNRVKRFLDLTG